MDDSEELLRPWWTPLVRETLEYNFGDRPKSSDPGYDRLWRTRLENVLFWTNRRPDVAARVLSSSFFSETPIAQPPPPPKPALASSSGAAASAARPSAGPILPGRLHDMCLHALAVDEAYRKGQQSPAEAEGTPAEIPREEVTFMAKLVEPCVRPDGAAALPDHRGALNTLLSEFRSHVAPTVDAVSDAILAPLQQLLARSQSADGASPPWEGPVLLAESVGLGPGAGDSDMLFPSGVDVCELWCRQHSGDQSGLGAPHLTVPFRAHGNDEATRQAEAEDARLRRTTLVRAEDNAAITRPKWAADVEAKYEEYERAAEEPIQVAPAKAELADADAAGNAGKPTTEEAVDGPVKQPAAEEAKEPAPEVTVVEDGALVWVNGRATIVPAKTKKNRETKPPQPAAAAPEEQPPEKTADTASKKDSGPESDEAEAPQRPKRSRSGGSRPSSPPPPAAPPTRERRREAAAHGKKKKGNASQGAKSQDTAAVSLRGVPLKSREELVEMVNALPVSAVLREAFLIGLEPVEARDGAHSRRVLTLTHSSALDKGAAGNTDDVAELGEDTAAVREGDLDAPVQSASSTECLFHSDEGDAE